MAIPAVLIAVALGRQLDFFALCAMELLLVAFGAALAIKRAQPFRWIEEKLGL